MIKIEDFKNAPVGTTATRAEGHRAMKIDDGEQSWITPTGLRVSNEHVWGLAYTLDPTVPATAREALDLAWDLAHEVKPGQTIPKGTRYLEAHNSGLGEYTAHLDFKISPELAPTTRTLDPLPDPEPELPDWLDAPSVLAVHESHTKPSIWGKHWDQETLSEFYQSALTAGTAHWSELHDVTPLYPKGQDS